MFPSKLKPRSLNGLLFLSTLSLNFLLIYIKGIGIDNVDLWTKCKIVNISN